MISHSHDFRSVHFDTIDAHIASLQASESEIVLSSNKNTNKYGFILKISDVKFLCSFFLFDSNLLDDVSKVNSFVSPGSDKNNVLFFTDAIFAGEGTGKTLSKAEQSDVSSESVL